MQFPESWLREFCNPPLSTEQLADALTMAGLEVEEVRPVAPPFTQVVVGEIKSAEQHPNADRLRVCQVDVGQGALLGIVCGAPNARAGIKVPCALVGAELPPAEGESQPFRIKLGKLRGVESQGMLCSARELKLSEDHAGLLELVADAPVGQDIREHLRLDDAVFTLKLTPNLGHALSVYGVARELAAITGAPLKTPKHPPIAPTTADVLPVKVSAPDLCGRFSGRVVRGVNTQATTPAWMVDRLARCGQRSVTALVDISNYVMFEYGRPTHIFDEPQAAVDQALLDGKIPAALPGIRPLALRLLTAAYPSRDAARTGIRDGLDRHYASREFAPVDAGAISRAADGIFAIYRLNVFPDMKMTFGVHRSHLGHPDGAGGCFRCHDEEHATTDGLALSQDCELCHQVLAQEEPEGSLDKAIADAFR